MKNNIEIPAQPIILEQKTEAIESFKARAEAAKKAADIFHASYESLGLGSLDNEGLQVILNRGLETFIRERITGNEPVMVGGLKLSMDKVREMVELPDLTAQKEAFAEFRKYLPLVASGIKVEGNHFEVDQEQVEATIKRSTVYAETDAEKEAWLLLEDMAEKAEYLNTRYGINLFAAGAPVLTMGAGSNKAKLWPIRFKHQIRS